MALNKEQNMAVTHNKGPMMVLAGPGSGKTLVITYRTKYLIEECGVNPSNILVITFTKAAAVQMQERFKELTKQEYYPVTFGTFHAVFFKILRIAYHLTADNILREEKKVEYIREIVENQELEIEDLTDFISSVIGEISLVKGEMISLDHYYAKSCSEEVFKTIYEAYQQRLAREYLIDFDDMLVKCYELLAAREDILAVWQQKYQYILIDEFQDINRIQYEIIKMLSRPRNNLFIVGDDDQSIYRFRGAKPEIMLNFEKDYKDAKRVVLNVNYRSTKEIVKTAQRLIKNNKKRFLKKIYTENQEGEAVEVREFQNVAEENQYVLELVKKYIEKGYEYKDLAFLFRTNIGPRALLEKFMEYNIPFRVKDALPNMFEHWIAKDILAYMRIVLGERQRADFLRIMNKPKRYLSRNAFQSQTVHLLDIKKQYADKDWMIDRIEKLEFDIQFMKNMAPYAAIQYIRSGIGYDGYLEEYAKYRRMNVEELYQILDELMESAKPFQTYEEWFFHIEEYGEKLLEQAKKKQEEVNRIEIATMHSAKGLEYPVVFILDSNEGVTPHTKAVLEEDLEEERRLFYVAVTRAKEKLHIYSVKERYNKTLSASRFVGEVLLHTDELKEGVTILHKKYGKGTIRKVSGGKMSIYFPKLKKELVFDQKFAVSNRIIKLQ